MFVHNISMFTALSLHNLQDLIFGCTPYWVIYSCIFTDLLFHCCHPFWTASSTVDWHLFVCIFHVVPTCIETHTLITNISISHIFIYILNCFYCFLLIWQLLTIYLITLSHVTNIIILIYLKYNSVFNDLHS